jgi:hypothetical protein
VKAPSVPVVSPPAVASIVAEPISAPVIVLVATPAAAVAVPVPVTVPAPEAFAKVTTVELSDVTVLPKVSRIVAVRTRVVPDARSAVEPVRAICVAGPGSIVIEGEAPRLASAPLVADERCCACQLCAPAGPGAVAPGPPLAVEPYVIVKVAPAVRVTPETVIVWPATPTVPVEEVV